MSADIKAEVVALTSAVTNLFQYFNAQLLFLFLRPRENVGKLRLVRHKLEELCRALDVETPSADSPPRAS